MKTTKEQLEKELKDLQLSFKNKKSGMSVNEYSSYYFELSKKIKYIK
jgi:hypothetical protein